MRYLFLLCVSFFYLFADTHVLLYHRFNDDRYPSTSISSEKLKEQFKYLKDNNYTIVKLDQIIKKLEKKEQIPSKWIAITIDDSYKSFYEHGFEIFKEFNYPFTMFVYVEGTNNKYPDFMNWEEIKGISKFGQIEYHSYAHPSMAKIDKKTLEDDFEKGLKLFEKNLGTKPQYFSYPYGEMNDYSEELIKKYNFRAIFNQNNGAVNEKSDIYNIDRLAIVGDVNLKNLLASRYLKVDWEEPKIYPKDNILKYVKAKVDTNKTKVKLYISGIGWLDVDIKDGKVDENINATLKNNRTRVILKVDNEISTKIITKGEQSGTK